ncbi:hypothetical protein [Kribbella sp. DT2]|uniref:hypothetical protein n=1 Tax=Kribbella sp. DT2 TaxID=3393427 RepID=UPI003CEC0320
MSNQSDYDRRVKDILDRVAKGHLSSDEAATLIAAVTKPTAAAPVADETPTAEIPVPEADEPSASVWADAVDSPDAADTASVPGAAGETAAPGAGPTSAPGAVQDSVVDDAPAEPVQTEVPEAGEVEEEVEHSNVPVPSGVQRVTIRAVGRRVRLIGEPAITGVAVDGPHVIKRDGNTLAINSEGDMGVSLDGFSMLRNPTDLKAHVNGFAKELSIRVNPMLEVEVEVTGGSVTAERLPGLARVRVTAGTAKVSDVDGPIDMLVQAGSAHLDAQITKGRSRVRVESGSATVNLRRGSDVRVHTESQLGRVTWAGAVNGQSKDVEIGRGRAALDVEVLVGTAQITSD